MDTKHSINHKSDRMFANILCIVVILAMAFPAMGSAYAQMDDPVLRAFPDQDRVDGWFWPVGELVYLTINDVPFAPQTADNTGTVEFLLDGLDLIRGDTITMQSGDISITYKSRELFVNDINLDSQKVSGTVDGQQTVHIWSGGTERYVDSDEYGNWLADFSDSEDPVLIPGACGNAEAWGESNSNSTIVDWCAPPPPPNPFIAVSLTEHWFWVNNYAPETLVTFSIYDGYGGDLILEFNKPTDASGNLAIAGWEHIWDPEPGDYIVATDGLITKDLVLEYVTLDVFDFDEDFLSGEASYYGRSVDIGVGNETGEKWMNVTADEDSRWEADFTLPEHKFDITDNSWAGAHVNDEDGDVTAAHNSGPPESPARFTAFSEQDAVEGWDFPLGAEVHLTIDDPMTEGPPDHEQSEFVTFAPWGSWQLWVWFDFAGEYNMKPGDIVTLTYGNIVRTHVVQNLAITKVNHEVDTIKGTASVGAEIHVWPHATGQEQIVIANPRGKWDVNFTGIYDLIRGDGGRAEIRDEMSNATAVDWYIPRPRIVASITEDWFFLQEFSPNKTLSFTLYEAQGGKSIWKGTATTDGSGFAWINADARWDLEPGNYLIVKDGQNTKDIVIEGFTFDVFNLSNGQLMGTAPEPDGSRAVWVGIGFHYQDAWTMDITTDGAGSWLADFGQPVPSDYWWVAAQIFDDDGDASELRPERILNDWIIAYSYDLLVGYWSTGEHKFHMEAEWPGGGETGQDRFFTVSSEAPSYYDGYVLLRPFGLRARGDDGTCPVIDPVIRPNQLTRFHVGYTSDPSVTYEEALAGFNDLSVWVVWDDEEPVQLVANLIVPSDQWSQYMCSFTEP